MTKGLRLRGMLALNPNLREAFADDDEGGLCLEYTATVAFTDSVAKTLFTIPSKAKILAIFVNVSVAFNDTGTDLLSIGKVGSASFYKASLDVSSTGQTVTGWVATSMGDVGSTDLVIQATYTGQNANASTGAATITFLVGNTI